MIRLTIQRKVFLTILALTTVLVVVLALALRWNLGQGFARYTSAAELARLSWLVEKIETAYAANGSWDFLRSDPERAWRRLTRPDPRGDYNARREDRDRLRSDDVPPRPRDFAPQGEPPPRWSDDRPPRPEYDFRPRSPRQDEDPSRPRPAAAPANDPLRIAPRLTLFDGEGQRVAGNDGNDPVGATQPIHHQGKIVGHLSLLVASKAIDELDAAFLASQTRNILLAGAAALVLSLLAAWGLARHLLAPIRDVADGARRIADGWLDARIPVRREDELGELAVDFNLMAERLARIEESRRAWISDASHELRTPLAVLRAEIEALQDGVRTPDAATLARLHKQVAQLAKLVDDLRLTLDRELDSDSLAHVRFSPLEVLAETIAAFRERYAAAGIGIELAGLNADNRTMLGDEGRITQVFINLLENSLRYTDAGGRLRIVARSDSRRLVVKFDDTAPAPPRAAMPHLFERFFRAEPSRSRALGGSGLGLAICKSLIEAHGGRIQAGYSDLGGLAVRIELPMVTT